MKLLIAIFASATLFSHLAAATALDDAMANAVQSSIDGGGRNVMRTAEGGIVASFASRGPNPELVFSRSTDNGKTWSNVVLNTAGSRVQQVAVDSNFNGSYVAFTAATDTGTEGRIAYLATPFAKKADYVMSPPVTPNGVVPRDTFIQASRAGWGDSAESGRETVAYGWQDTNSKGIYIGVSLDGKSFPVAKLVVEDAFATSGPAVAIRGNFVIATYQTTHPSIVPGDVPASSRSGRSYPAWIESHDGGISWSKPAPLFGQRAADFPMVQLETPSGDFQRIRLAGGTSQPNSPILNWSSSSVLAAFGRPELDKSTPLREAVVPGPLQKLNDLVKKLGGTTFVQSSMMGVQTAGQSGEVSIVSFRPIEQEAKWTHVIANNKLTMRTKRLDGGTSTMDAVTSQFQYSALIDTAVRATIYKEFDAKTHQARLVAAVSTDTGKSFRRHISLDKEQLQAIGIEDFRAATVFAASQCLFQDRDGRVYVDIVVTGDSGTHYARVPLGVNAADLRAQ